jgi:wyosine [tRNA(Phe)-imidazoG37] synthetase (radical SAM superfamily)
MKIDKGGITFGPVPSRRLGRSLGINTIPAKTCSYACVYCQIGRTAQMRIERRQFYPPDEIFKDVRDRLERTGETTQAVNYLTLVPDGEPTLDVNLGQEISQLQTLRIPVGVITNSSLLWRKDVREELAHADWVSLKIDTVDEGIWRRINRPHPALQLADILDGIRAFAQSFSGTLVTETMLVRGVNDTSECMEGVADFLHALQPSRAYLSIPIRPPAEPWALSPDEETLNRMYQIVATKIGQVEYLIGYEGNDFSYTGDVEQDLLNITAVHPMREEAVNALLARAGCSREVVERLLIRGDLKQMAHDGRIFYLRTFTKG